MIWAPAPGFEVDAEIAAVCDSAVRQLAAAGTEVIEVERMFTEEPLADWFTHVDGLLQRRQGHLRGTPDWERIDPGLRAQMDHAEQNVDAVTLRQGHRLGPHPQPRSRWPCSTGRRCCCARPSPARPPRSAARAIVNGQESQFALAFTGAYNLTRNPAGTVCAGFTADGMPVGLQVVGPQHADVAVMRAIAALEEILGLDPVAPIADSLPQGELASGGATTVPRSHPGRYSSVG